MPDFISLGISKELTEILRSFGIATPTPIQKQAIPVVMKGKDVIAQAQTGTGKTFAFILPILEKLDVNALHVQALIVTPTRELALQITDEINKMIQDLEKVNVLAVYGGQDVEKQLKRLEKNVQIVVGTPGRLLDHIRRGTLDLSRVHFLVLDEADQMLHIGFLGEVEDIIKETPKSRQTMLFSATIPDEVRNLAKKHMREPEYIQVEKRQGPAANVKQIAIHTIDRAKQATLIQLVETHRPFLAVIFCRTKRRVSKLFGILKAHGFSCDELHGDLSQAKREQVMKRFRDAEIQLLIATDVAARGLDVEGVTHVFNYDIPQDAESYVHRIGRTGRAGMKGLAITFYSSADRPTLDMIEKELNIRIQKQVLDGEGKKEQSKKLDRDSKAIMPKQTKGNQQKRKPLNSKANQFNGQRKNSEKSGLGSTVKSPKKNRRGKK
ncbi:DEAD/DEAH box helicase [Bacillus salipaludis]|uniref:DEAD/DEAH box helicase n=1 Tax=Bacillus salipaludis TaxID=2547811 RepID=UPI003D228BE6